jgi:hypothetical protein
MRGRVWKIVAFNLGLSMFNVLLFSNAFFRIPIFGASAVLTALGVTDIVMSAALFVLVNRRLLTPPQLPPPVAIETSAIQSLDACAEAVQAYIDTNVKTFAGYLSTVVAQLRRMNRKKDTMKSLLSEKFSETEMSYGRFYLAVCQAEELMIHNVKTLLNRVLAFDEGEYEDAISTGKPGVRINETRRGILKEYTQYIERAVENNDEILVRLDKLILETSKLSGISGSVEDLDAIKQIDSLIDEAHWYK